MKKINVQAKRNDEYIIEIDEKIFNDEALKEWSSVFHEVESIEEFAEALAFQILRFGSGEFYEGFGIIKTINPNGHLKYQTHRGKLVTEDQYTKGILVTIVDEDNDHDFEMEVING